MISVNTLLSNSLKKVGVVGERETPDGTELKLTLADLNSLTRELNLNNMIAETRVTEIVQSNGANITLGPSTDFNLNIKDIPDTMISVCRKVGNRYIRMIKSNLTAINSKTKMSLATQYSYGMSYDEEHDCMKGTIYTDSNIPHEYLLIFNKSIPVYKMSDKIKFSDTICELLESGLCFKIATRKKLNDLQVWKEEFDAYKDLVESINSNNRPLIENEIMGSYLDDYYNGLAGYGW